MSSLLGTQKRVTDVLSIRNAIGDRERFSAAQLPPVSPGSPFNGSVRRNASNAGSNAMPGTE